jgi:uncharacterized protein (TIGR03437 family)
MYRLTLALRCVLVTAAAFTTAAFAQQTSTFTYNGLPLYIPSDAANVISIARIAVPVALKMTKVTVQLQIQYPKSGDLKVYLYSPEGTRTILLEHDCSVQNVDTTFDDSASSLWKDFCPVEAGRGPFRPDQPLSNFNSDDSSFGYWRLALENDESDSRTGFMTQFAITITGTPQVGPVISSQTILNAASIDGAGTVAPGEMLSVFGLNMGPATGVSAPAGALPTNLGGTTVTFNGTPAPIAYASNLRVDVQAPFSLTPGATAAVQVNNGGQASNTASLSVVAAVPGVYTNSIDGAGPAVVTNQDGSANSILNPAAKGSVIVVYASGLGTVSPGLTEGAVPPVSPLSNVVGTVGAYIDGLPATVLFAGAAPGFPGLYQLNVQVPAGASSRTQELLVFSNGASSQKRATVEIQ